tara:strand:+ start:29 stop:292 length:264 start_codon:yes stop_codon:yes gene_type:complete
MKLWKIDAWSEGGTSQAYYFSTKAECLRAIQRMKIHGGVVCHGGDFVESVQFAGRVEVRTDKRSLIHALNDPYFHCPEDVLEEIELE